tara:strand:+ start:1670 stop:2245 length:576 start_codon:yes stop_codon:yes gene_type:complete
MSGEGLSVSFRRTSQTKESNDELLWKFQDLVYPNKKIMSHMKWYGKLYSVQLIEHGDEELQKWQQEDVAIKDSFQFYISVYESWGDDSNYYECHKTEGSFVSVAQKFALDYNLMYFPLGFPSEWIEQEIIDGEKNWNHFKVKADDKNIDRICDVWYNYSIIRITQDTDKHWSETKERIKNLMNKEKCAITQ